MKYEMLGKIFNFNIKYFVDFIVIFKDILFFNLFEKFWDVFDWYYSSFFMGYYLVIFFDKE